MWLHFATTLYDHLNTLHPGWSVCSELNASMLTLATSLILTRRFSQVSAHQRVFFRSLGMSDTLYYPCRWTPRTGTGLCPPVCRAHPKTRCRSLCPLPAAQSSAPPGWETGCCRYVTTASPWRLHSPARLVEQQFSRCEGSHSGNNNTNPSNMWVYWLSRDRSVSCVWQRMCPPAILSPPLLSQMTESKCVRLASPG